MWAHSPTYTQIIPQETKKYIYVMHYEQISDVDYN